MYVPLEEDFQMLGSRQLRSVAVHMTSTLHFRFDKYFYSRNFITVSQLTLLYTVKLENSDNSSWTALVHTCWAWLILFWPRVVSFLLSEPNLNFQCLFLSCQLEVKLSYDDLHSLRFRVPQDTCWCRHSELATARMLTRLIFGEGSSAPPD